MRSLCIFVAILALGATSAGCSIWNAPNRGLLDAGSDGGVDAFFIEEDAWAEPDANDAGVDTGVDAAVCATTETSCGDGLDQDCDDLIDCADPQCIASGAAECCDATHTERLDEDFGAGALLNWQRDGAAPIVSDGAIVSFGSAGVIGMVRQRSASVPACFPVELGTRVELTLQAITCTGGACEGFAQVVLGPSSRYRAGTRLTTDLAIRGTTHDGSLTIDLLEGTRVVHQWADLGTTPKTVLVELGLGVSGGVPAIVAQVTVDDETASDVHVVDRSDVDLDVCDGLFLGIEGTGNDVRLDDVNVTQRDCSNPSRMDPVGVDTSPLDAITFSANAWAGGGIGDPAIFAGRPTIDDTWFVLFDGSTDDRASDSLHNLPLALGGGDSTREVSGQLALSRACPDWTPRAGVYFPGCDGDEGMPLTDEMPSRRAMRDPTLYADTRTQIGFGSLHVVWAGERSADDSTMRLFNGVLNLGSPTTRRLPVSDAELEIEDETCHRFRSPLLLPLVGSTSDWLLLYVCEDTFPSEVRGATGNFLDRFVAAPSIHIGEEELGSLAAGGVRDLAGVVFSYESGAAPTYRLWLVTSSKRDGLLVVFVEGRATAGGVPSFVPYPGNPVLTATDPALPPCTGPHCEIHGIGATRLPSSPTAVRLLVERWDDTGTATTYSLLPLAQTWRSDVP